MAVTRPTPEVARRRQAAVLAIAAVSLILGVITGASSGGGSSPAKQKGPAAIGGKAPVPVSAAQSAAHRMPLAQQVGQLVVLRFAGTTAPSYVRTALRRNRVAGAILFRDNASSPSQVTALTGQLRPGPGTGKPLICIDQEGGGIRILPWSPPQAAEPAQGAAGPRTAGADARAAAEALRKQGITVALAPVADTPQSSSSAMTGREFSRDPRAAAADVDAAVRGWRAGGVAPTLKHFPGLGGARVNTDDGTATITRTRAELASDLTPFRAGIAAGAPIVMVSSAVYTALDPDRIASQSLAVTTSLLRRQLGFKGVAMTDSIEAAAVRAVTPDPGAAAVASVGAGIDVVLTTGRGSYLTVYRALLAQAKADPAFRARVQQSAARVLALRASL
jgi:beta-N-acetylhexosaminidase